ncbi:MAG: GTP-binding protein TypA [Candidatus Nealsonbacteria bacterium RIFCSPHIGHO2_01_FULL_38_55]|uniref:50S ribosomal subunit assembly factor BipA n=2 Tax=Candidatus Nealsoniibacteriota TaxID=1817911 RepID=A0A1G2EKS5_9BACT|nr:MAG: GTP-binding protein TypA/BipA [Parcubacteria group bacterium GW2011_GWA2_38_27]KKQ98702.1 MAG: GTP-binding protein TypA/BipA [Parcubacteria group bacterium GW2011_GWC2_39_11]OGZ19659.1 MAG: GTP-binding protein TypA [Candidatus Nealsonbacteria bacterium RIFCSPHIGHO2_01_FULL_38_55]OGZ20667.1 MAG: GTP-binding protein TypA [Candidatus Nealsonbacteria bacterium RIFCSPHIGHO2_02_38_10]OGZ21203.1 MAG: GTP-binding protein TypA [Candidatus Nealsonbacteria bacterium RIFCSPHIGHO2_02_FULL_38_75]OGZ
MEIRNIAIIAHVDHGKTTLTDALMRQTGVGQEGVSMDSNALELERGITIYSKNAAVFFRGTKINIVDTPGHADFGSEVERVLRSIDSVLLLVDAQEGPMPQTRFVLKKSLELGLKPIVVINKIDKTAADPARCEEQVLELFMELGANDKQLDFPIVYAIGRLGIAKLELKEDSNDLTPLLETILKYVPCASNSELEKRPLLLQPFNLAYDNFMGRLAIGRIYQGIVSAGQKVFIKKSDGESRSGSITKIFTFSGLERTESQQAVAGDIVLIAGLSDIYIGETITSDENVEPLPAIAIDEPTITLSFLVNNSPFSGKEGNHVTSREIREYLMRELEVNVGLKVDFNSLDNFKVSGRGELHIEILLENMRRSGYEVQVSQPHVIFKEENGIKIEPFEEVIVDTPGEYKGVIIERLGSRGFFLKSMNDNQENERLYFEGPTRGLLGYKNQFVIDTKGLGILSSRVIGFRPYAGEIRKKSVGSMTSMEDGKAIGYALWSLQERGILYIGPGTQVYNGMVIGNTSKGEEMSVNPTKGKHLTNVRAAYSDDAIDLTPFYELTIGKGLEFMGEDEYLEITPKSVRLRKKYLTKQDRAKARRQK